MIAHEIVDQLVERLGLFDACVFEVEGRLVCAYVTGGGRSDPSQVMADTLRQAGHDSVLLHLRRLPRNADGSPSLEALRAAYVAEPPIETGSPAFHIWNLGETNASPAQSEHKITRPSTEQAGAPSILRGPRLELPSDDFLTFPARLRACAAGHGMLSWTDARGHERRITYATLLDNARAVSKSLAERAITPGDRVFVVGSDGIDFFGGLWGCLWAGIVACPFGKPKRPTKEDGDVARLAVLVVKLGAKAILVGRSTDAPVLQNSLEALGASVPCLAVPDLVAGGTESSVVEPAQVKPDDLALLLFTSGSTGLPKATMLTHRNVLSMAEGLKCRHGFSATDSVLNWMPLEHVGVLGMLSAVALATGAAQFHVDTTYVLADPLRWLDLIDRHRTAYSWAPHFAFALIGEQVEASRKRNWDLSCVKRLLNGGEVVVAGGVKRFLDIAIRHGLKAAAIGPTWGMSETSSSFLLAEGVDMECLSGSPQTVLDVGTPHPGGEARLVDAHGHVVPVGQEGRLEVRGPQINVGYFSDADATTGSRDENGWFRTGDRGRIEAGRMIITGRDKEIVILRGQNFSLQALESAVEESAFVSTSFVAASGVKDPRSAVECLAIFFHSEEPIAMAARDIRDRLRKAFGIAPDYLIPLAREGFPKTAIGKIQRARLRSQFEAGAFRERIVALDLQERNARTLPQWFFVPRWEIVAGGSTQRNIDNPILVDGDPDAREIARITGHLAHHHGEATILTAGRDDAAAPDEVPRPGSRGLAAALRCLLAENPTLRVRLVHVPTAARADLPSLLRRISSYPFADSASSLRMEAILHRDRLWRYGLGPMPADVLSAAPIIDGGNGCVVLTGGTGRLGSLIARHLRNSLGLSVVVAGRGDEHDTELPYIRMNVADPESIREALRQAELVSGERPKGIIHLAGSTRVGVALANETEDSFADHLRGKRTAAGHLRSALADVGGGALILFSSVNAHLGGYGAGAYASANAAMEQAMLSDRASGVRTISLAWSLWHTRDTDEALTKAANGRGFLPLAIEQGLASMEVALRAASSGAIERLLIGLDGAHPEIAALWPIQNIRAPLRLAGIEPVASEAEPLKDEVEQQIASIWKVVLSRSVLSPTDNFFDLGGNSLLIARLHEQLRQTFAADVPMGELFYRTTVRDQAALYGLRV
ncbi:MAG: AMP-binding protein [Rhodospirillales bacterium]|nr:AMP-binding protein [Rhodospirillales bacterium]